MNSFKILNFILIGLWAATAPAKIDLKLMFGANTNLYSTSNFTDFESYTNPATKTLASYQIFWNSGLSYFFEIGTVKENFMNFKLGYNYESERSISFFVIKNKTTGIEQTLYASGQTAKLKMDDVYVDSTYRWDRPGYLILGLNYCFPKFTPSPATSTYQATTTGRLGFNIGGGLLFFNETMAIELISRYRYWSLKLTDPATTYVEDYGNGNQAQLNFNLKFLY